MSALRRRLVSIPAVFVAGVALFALLPLWLPLAIVVDLLRGRWRLPIARLGLFGVCWAWLEVVGVSLAGLAWLTFQGRNRGLHYRLQAWWAASLIAALQLTTGAKLFTNVVSLPPGPVVMLCRHASLADSLVSAWVITSQARLRPRYVLKKELLWDPCLDVVGGRLPNHFVDRQSPDSAQELRQLTLLSSDMGERDVTVIFPEGTRASPSKRERALASIERTQPGRARRMAELTRLLPPRPAGTLALLDGAPDADIVVAWHAGFDGLDTFAGILRHMARRPPPVRFATRRIPRVEVPMGPDRATWLDELWLRLDADTAALIALDQPTTGS